MRRVLGWLTLLVLGAGVALATAYALGYVEPSHLAAQSADAVTTAAAQPAGDAAAAPAGRVGRPEDAARLAAFLASDEAAWITGQIMRSRGGL
ncbi:MAG: SDR family oxidoreductase [Caldilineaceae bacterium]|nr:SDR family oxidoreductase [Caldilineaceae bacterium]